MGLVKKIVLAIILGYLANKIIRIISMQDLDRIMFYHEPGPCHLVPGADEGSEDLEVMRNGIALITSGLKIRGAEGTKHRISRILKFDFNNPEAGVEEVKIVNAEALPYFNAHGISIWEDAETGEIRVFVVIHPVENGPDYVGIFEYDVKSNTMKLLKLVTHDDYGLNNDVLATGPDTFYTTVYSYTNTYPLITMMEALWEIRLTSIMYYDGVDSKKVDTGLLTPNGITMSPDGRTLYVAASIDRTLRVYKRNTDNSIDFIREIALGTVPDNLNVDRETGDIWIGSHPVGCQITNHMINLEKPAPSQVLRIKIQGDTEFVEEVYSDPGMHIFGSSSADRFKDAIIVGTIQHKLLYCKLNHIS